MKRRILIAAGAALALVAAFVAGRYSAPVRTETVEVKSDSSAWLASFLASLETQQTATTKKHVETRKTKKPDGTIEIVRVEDSGSDTKTNTTSNVAGTASATTESTSATRTVTEGQRPGWSAGVSAGWDPRALSLAPDRLGLELDRRIVGTVWLGLRASAGADFTSPQVGAAVRMEF